RTVLGIEVDAALLADWRTWYSPALHPFPTSALPPALVARLPARTPRGRRLCPRRDTGTVRHAELWRALPHVSIPWWHRSFASTSAGAPCRPLVLQEFPCPITPASCSSASTTPAVPRWPPVGCAISRARALR